jgi:hypothetical protein
MHLKFTSLSILLLASSISLAPAVNAQNFGRPTNVNGQMSLAFKANPPQLFEFSPEDALVLGLPLFWGLRYLNKKKALTK